MECVAAGDDLTSVLILPARISPVKSDSRRLRGDTELQTNNTNLAVFLLLSVGLHIVLIASWHTDEAVQLAITEAGAPLRVALSEPQQQQQRQAVEADKTETSINASKPLQRVTVNKPVPYRPVITRQSEQQAPMRTAQAVSSTLTTSPQHEPEPVQNESSQAATSTRHDHQQWLNARIQKQLQIKIAFHRNYPGLAIRNAWEGRVRLGIRVQANGDLSNIHVIDSSGYRILDRAALKSVRHIATLPGAGSWLQGQTIDVILPVIYKLTDS